MSSYNNNNWSNGRKNYQQNNFQRNNYQQGNQVKPCGDDTPKEKTFDYSTLKFYSDEKEKKLLPDLFDKKAESIASDWCSSDGKKGIKKTKLRKFFNETKLIYNLMSKEENGYEKYAFRFSMMVAKIAYDEGRSNKEEALYFKRFRDFFKCCKGQVHSIEDFKVFINLFECVYGFYYAMAPNEKNS